MSSTKDGRSEVWIWWVCGLLLLASTINYMDRQTLSGTSDLIKEEFRLNHERFALLETAFGFAFAAGALVFGFVADRTSVRWLYPVVLLLWSTMGFLTGFAETYTHLLLCRLFLGVFEAGHWPCALKSTQKLLPSSKRTLGNSVLQSGTAIGAMVTPLVIKMQPNVWRPTFQILGAVGLVWIFLWLISIRREDLDGGNHHTSGTANGESAESPDSATVRSVSFLEAVFSRKYLALVFVVILINICWHQFRVWMKLFLMEEHQFSASASLDVIFWFNVMTDIGCLAAGFASAFVHRQGLTPHRSRSVVFGVCSLLVAAGALLPLLESSTAIIAVLMAVGLGALGLFPCYYAMSQELSVAHQGKVTGSLGTIAWVTQSIWVWQFGRLIDRTHSYDLGMCIVSLMPLGAMLALCLLWPREIPESRCAPSK